MNFVTHVVGEVVVAGSAVVLKIKINILSSYEYFTCVVRATLGKIMEAYPTASRISSQE